ncbi:hypothetical protein Tco_0260903 [Tanacetum coccineum]
MGLISGLLHTCSKPPPRYRGCNYSFLLKTTNLRNEITRFQQRFDESFYEAWDRFNDLLRACPHHGFLELHQLDTFYNALNANDQDSLNSMAGGNFLDKMPRECLRIIESKSKVRNSRNKAVIAKVSSNSSTLGISPDVAALTTEVSELKNLMKTMLIDKQKAQASASEKAVPSRVVNSKSGQGTLPSQTITNPHEHVNAITTRSGKTCEGPSTPLVPTPVVSIPLKEPEQNPETSMDKVQKPQFQKIPTNEPFSSSTTNHSDALPPSSSPVKTSKILKEFVDELTLLKKDVHVENFQVYSNPLFEFDNNFTSSNENPLFNEMDEDVVNKNSNVLDEPFSSNFEEGYFDSKGDVIFLKNLLSDDTTHNLAPEVISDHEPKQDESIHNTSITFSPRSDPLSPEICRELIKHILKDCSMYPNFSEDSRFRVFVPESLVASYPLLVGIRQKSQENHLKRANTDTGNGRAQKKPGIQGQKSEREGLLQSKGRKDNSSGQVHNGREKDVILIGKVKQRITRGLEKAQGMG